MNVAFVACVEAGYLEDQTVLLCHSIRRFGGRFRDAAIHTFQPRAGQAINERTRRSLRELGCHHDETVLNTRFVEFPHTNKVFAAARAEQRLSEEILVFVDSDTLFTAEPRDLELPPACNAAALPVNNCRLGSAGQDDPNEQYWQRMYEICGVDERPFVTAVTDDARIRAYFNSGLVAVRRSAGLFTRWRENLLRLIDNEHVSPATGLPGMDEFSLAATLGGAFPRVRVLDLRYNYPLTVQQRPLLPLPQRSWQWEEMIHVHYRNWFSHPDVFDLLRPRLRSVGPVADWLRKYLPLRPLHPQFQTQPAGHGTTGPVDDMRREGAV